MKSIERRIGRWIAYWDAKAGATAWAVLVILCVATGDAGLIAMPIISEMDM